MPATPGVHVDFDVAVLGAGPAGLAAAYRVAGAGHRVVVLERSPHVGGMARSFDVAGVRVDHGSHRLHPTTPPPVLALLRDLLGADLQRRRRHGRIALAGRLVAFPPQPLDLLRHLPPPLAARLAFDVARVALPSRRNATAPTTFADAITQRFGPTMLHEFYGPFTTKLFGADPEHLDVELARRRVGARSGADVLRRTQPLRRRDSDAGTFFSPRHGFGQLVDALAGAAVGAGAKLETSTAVERLVPHADHVEVHCGERRIVRAGSVWSTLPLPVLASLAGAPPPVLDAASALEYRALVLVYLVVPQPRWTEYDAHYFPGRDITMSRISEPKNYRDRAEDPADVTVLCAELPCSPGDAVWDAGAEELARLVEHGIARSGLPPVRPIDVEVRRIERAYPVYRVGYGACFDPVDAWASAVPNVVHFGRQALFAHDNTHHAFAMAWAAADALRADGSFDAVRWSGARDRFRDHVVED
jgi:protoporphyrinogen oxidase